MLSLTNTLFPRPNCGCEDQQRKPVTSSCAGVALRCLALWGSQQGEALSDKGTLSSLPAAGNHHRSQPQAPLCWKASGRPGGIAMAIITWETERCGADKTEVFARFSLGSRLARTWHPAPVCKALRWALFRRKGPRKEKAEVQ